MTRKQAITAAAAVALVLGIVQIGRSTGDSHDSVVAYFADASPLDPGSSVRAFGVDVGKVETIELTDGVARVTFALDDKILPLHDDATMRIRPVNVLGEHYIELEPGSPEAPLADDAVIPAERTSSTVDVQDVINTFDDPTSAALAALVTGLGEGLHDNGANVEDTLAALMPAMKDVDKLAELMKDQNAVLNQLIERVSPLVGAVATERGVALDRLIRNAQLLLQGLAVKEKALDETVKRLPATLRSATVTLGQLQRTAQATTPKLRRLKPITDDLDEISKELRAFSESADPALAALVPVLQKADDLLAEARPSVRRLRAAGPDLSTTTAGLRPVGNAVLDRNLSDLMLFVKKWALSTNGRDGLSHYFRGVVHVTPRAINDLASIPGNPQATPESSASNDPLEGLLSGAGVDLGAVDDLLEGLRLGSPQKSSSDAGNATGLSPEQEHGLLNQLLGGGR